MLPLVQLFQILLTLAIVESAPTLGDIRSDITLLIHDDIQGPQSPKKDSGVLLLSAQPQRDAIAACGALDERLWAPEMKRGSIQSSLDYLNYQGQYSLSQQYLIAPTSAGARAISGKGKVNSVPGYLQLPVLCTQTAPFSNATYKDNSKKWQISVRSNNNYISGFRDRVSFRFLGVRYAAQPKRFTYSTPYKGTGEHQPAIEYGSICVFGGSGSEDCLFLNIWTPYLPLKGGKSSHLKPVMFIIHGGGSNANEPSLDGASLVSRGDVVVVVINYRVATFGNLALDDGMTKGNFGFADQITALDWVRENIKDFGGDPNRITVLGQSYGAISVMSMIESPKAIGKFSAAIAQSYTAGSLFGTVYANHYDISEVASTTSAAILQETNCTSGDKKSQLDCLRAVPAYTLSNLATSSQVLTKDGTYLTSDRLILNKSAPVANVHLMMGYLRDDGGSFPSFPTTGDLKIELENLGFPANEIIASGKFPEPPGPNKTLNVFNVTSRVSSDTTFRCLDAAAAYAGFQNKLFKPDLYFYEFNRSYQPVGWNPNPNVCLPPVAPEKPLGDLDGEYFKCHSGEVYYTFGTIVRNGLPHRDENDLKFEQFIVDSWTSFARTFNPNPDLGFLKARGYTNSIAELGMAGLWQPVKQEGLSMRVLQWPTFQAEFQEQEQCKVLGIPLDIYLK